MFRLTAKIKFGNLNISPVSHVKDLGVTLTSDISLDRHVSNTVRSCNYNLRLICHIRKYLDQNSTRTLINAYVVNRLDFCNSLFTSLANTDIHRLQKVQNNAARIVVRLPKRSHVTPILSALHWLPIKSRINYKIALLTYKIITNSAPFYLSPLLSFYAPTRPLRSADNFLLACKTYSLAIARSSFSFYSPNFWNTLPVSVRSASTLSAFKTRLKTFLFQIAFHVS
jgi:hypothetical protein